jgi:hypothetical protein
MTKYQQQLQSLLSPAEHRVLRRLNTPKKVQDFLDSFPTEYFSPAGEPTIKSPHAALKAKKIHCMEGAMIAVTALAYHGREPLLMDLQSASFDYDHVVALFKQGRYWGAVSKTNHSVLRWRDPVYLSPRELAMSYYNEYFWPEKDRRFRHKTMLAYSKPFDLRRYHPSKWFAAKDLDWLAEALDSSHHFPVVPKGMLPHLRRANLIEVKAMKLEEWKESKK